MIPLSNPFFSPMYYSFLHRLLVLFSRQRLTTIYLPDFSSLIFLHPKLLIIIILLRMLHWWYPVTCTPGHFMVPPQVISFHSFVSPVWILTTTSLFFFSLLLSSAAPPDTATDSSWVLLDTQSNVDFSSSNLTFPVTYTASYQYYAFVLAKPLPPVGAVTLVAFCPYNAPVPVPVPPVPVPPTPSTSQPTSSPVVIPPPPGVPPTSPGTFQPTTSAVVTPPVPPPVTPGTFQPTTSPVATPPGPPPKLPPGSFQPTSTSTSI